VAANVICCRFGYRYHTLSPHTYIYIAVLLHRSSINSVLHFPITTIRESYEPGFAYCTAKLLKFTHSTAISLARLIASTRGTRLIATTRNSTHRNNAELNLSQAHTKLDSSRQRGTRLIVILTSNQRTLLSIWHHSRPKDPLRLSSS
jgi:hypothetical protein